MINLKPGTRLHGIKPEMMVALMSAQDVWRDFGQVLVITSCVDGKHTRASKHYSGCAVDLRTSVLNADQQKQAQKLLADALGSDFDVILESDHMHIEYDPKEPF